MSLFRLCRTSAPSEREAARRALAHVAARFREGRDNGLLRAAHVLLEQAGPHDESAPAARI